MGNRNSKSRNNQSSNYANELASSSKNSDKYTFEGGRRYHNVENSKYFLPNDDDECDRLHVMHFTYRFIWRSNFSAPVEDLLKQEGSRVLDVGFTGVDISPIQPGYIKPKNAEFIEANILERLPFDNDTFDFVFQRLLFAGIPENEWHSVINELVRVLKPGGYIELFELDFQYSIMGPATTKIINGIINLFHERGLDTHICYKLQRYLEQQKQLHNVHFEIKKRYDGEDAEKLCRLAAGNYATFLETMKPKLMSIIDVPSDEYDDLVKNMKNEIIELKSFNPQ
ncbi:11467_t:CDS:2, partial [Racocetra persica]